MEDQTKTYNMSATKIQRWYRRHVRRRKAGQAAMKRLLEGKRQELEEQLQRDRDYLGDGEKRSAEDRKRTREDKARQARQHAIQVCYTHPIPTIYFN